MTTFRVELGDARELFEAPGYDPLGGRFEREPALERVLQQLDRPQRGRGVLEVVTAASIVPDQLQRAISNYCETERAEAARLAKLTRKRGRQALWIGLPVLGLCLVLSAATALLNDHAIGGVLSNGFMIAGWVAVWRPAELLLYDWWPFAHRAKRLERLARLEVRVRETAGRGA